MLKRDNILKDVFKNIILIFTLIEINMKEQKTPTLEAQRKKRLEYALKDVEWTERNFDKRIGDEDLKNDINFIFHSIDKDLKVVRFIKKEDKEEFFDNPYFDQLTEGQYRAVKLYVDAIIELTFAESCLMFKTDNPRRAMNSPETNEKIDYLMNEIEWLENMHDKGLLSDEELLIEKNKLLGRD